MITFIPAYDLHLADYSALYTCLLFSKVFMQVLL